jgi:hypothetical protein
MGNRSQKWAAFTISSGVDSYKTNKAWILMSTIIIGQRRVELPSSN